ncbi:unnamed protein product [Adineta steineri]|uniref:Uncharacterized protein n=1 Tax=Adineta steineri TaxID=433720 RepID=A0A815BG29_9BILA|nr:unnamed protein product [Adineta steineri]
MDFFKNLFNHDQAKNAHNQVYGGNQDNSYDDQQQNQGSFTHEAIAGAAGFAAIKAYEDRIRNSGEQVSHPMMKEILAGLAAAEVDKLFETKGLDYLDKEKAKRMAIQQAQQLADEKYGSGGVFNPNGSQGQNQGYGGNNSGNYQQDQFNDNNQGYDGQNYGNQGSRGYDQQNYGGGQGQQQQWGDGNDQQNYGGGRGQQQQQWGGDNDQQNYGGGRGQQQQWGDGNEEPRPEHHRHHHQRREEDD